MPSLRQQFSALLWKCYLVRKRNWVSLLFEIALPLLFTTLFTALVAYGAEQAVDKGIAPGE